MDATTQRTLSAIWGKRPLESDGGGGGKSGEEPASKRPAAAVAAVVVTWPRADAWDDRHVRLACSPRNGTADGRRKWPEIAATLRALTPTAEGLCDAIFAVNASYRGSWDLSGLTRFFARDGAGGFDGTLLLRMADAALRLPALCGDAPLPLLRKGRGGVVVLTQAQIACLLCNAFFCTFPRRNEPISAQSEYKNFPSINFTTLFRLTTPPCKLRFLLHYFDRVTSALGDASFAPLNGGGRVVFERRVLSEAPDWKTSAKRLCEVVATSDGVIEDDAPGHRHVDFANKRLGGGVLGHGAVQEEIMFLTHPELIVARLLCEELGDSEAVIVRGAERFSRYHGYSRELEYAGDFRDLTPFSTDHVREVEVIAIDALDFKYAPPLAQWSPRFLAREINKAYCGMQHTGAHHPPKPIATGHWGCGAFLGSRPLKALLQLLAASEADCPCVRYFTFGDAPFAAQITALWNGLRRADVSVGRLWNVLQDFSRSLYESSSSFSAESLFGFISKALAVPLPSPSPSPAPAPIVGVTFPQASLSEDAATEEDECTTTEEDLDDDEDEGDDDPAEGTLPNDSDEEFRRCTP